jgi:hypothetical protein
MEFFCWSTSKWFIKMLKLHSLGMKLGHTYSAAGIRIQTNTWVASHALDMKLHSLGCIACSSKPWPEIETKVWTYDTYDMTSRYHPDKRKLPSKNMRGPYKTCTSVKLGVTQLADTALQSMYLLITDLERECSTNHQLDVGNPHRSQHASYGCHEGGSYPPWQQL